MMNGKFKFGWVIEILSKGTDNGGIQIEIANLGDGKHMIVATDITHPLSDNIYRQSGFGPFVFDKDE